MHDTSSAECVLCVWVVYNSELASDLSCMTPAQQSDDTVPVTAAAASSEQEDEDVKRASDSTAWDDVTTGADDSVTVQQASKHDQLTEREPLHSHCWLTCSYL